MPKFTRDLYIKGLRSDDYDKIYKKKYEDIKKKDISRSVPEYFDFDPKAKKELMMNQAQAAEIAKRDLLEKRG